MRGFALVAACLLAASATVQTVKAQELVDGQVTKIDETAGKITLRHGPIKKFDMTESMTMDDVVGRQSPHDAVRLTLARLDGQLDALLSQPDVHTIGGR